MVRLLNVPGIDINYQLSNNGSTALHGASFAGREESVVLLLAIGANTDIKNFTNLTARQGPPSQYATYNSEARVKCLKIMDEWSPQDTTWRNAMILQFPRLSLLENCPPWSETQGLLLPTPS